jgi:hypothetical protein
VCQAHDGADQGHPAGGLHGVLGYLHGAWGLSLAGLW